MKKSITLTSILLLIFATLILAPSCKKKSGGDEKEQEIPKGQTISFKANGVQKTFTSAWFNTFQEGNYYVLFISGIVEGNDKAFFSMKITSSSPIKEMNYVNDTGDARSIEFTDTDGKIYYPVAGPDNKIDVDKKTDYKVEGTFSGTVSGPGGNVNITDGIFRCERAA